MRGFGFFSDSVRLGNFRGGSDFSFAGGLDVGGEMWSIVSSSCSAVVMRVLTVWLDDGVFLVELGL